MSATQQKIRQAQTQKTEQTSLLQTGTWSKVFPKQHNTETKSCTFVKKLMAVAISNITYLRSIFPEKVFSNRTLDGLPLKILKEDAGCEAATNLVNWLRGAFEALEKRYLRELMLVIYLDPENYNEVYEMYTFRFGYSNGDRAECQLLQGTDQKQVHTVTDDDLYKATQMMLRTIIVLVQGLGPLPDSAYMTMKLTYYNEVTPIDYEPQGFSPTEWISPQFPTGAVSFNSGEVSTNFHTVKLKVKAAPKELLIKECQEAEDKTAAITNSFSASESEIEERKKEVEVGQQQNLCYIKEENECPSERKLQNMPEIQNIVRVTSTIESVALADANTVEASVSLLSGKTETEENCINDTKCVCKNDHPDKLMLMCNICLKFQHGACYRIIFQSDVPGKHICVPCSLINEKLVCTDPKLAKMASMENAPATCIFRRALACLLNVKIITISYLKKTLGIDEEYAEGVMAKLVKDKIVTESVSGEHNVDSEILRTSSLPKYLGIKRYKQMNYPERGHQVLIQNNDIKKDKNKNIEKEENGSNEFEENISDSIKAVKGTTRKLRIDIEKFKEVESEYPSSKRSKCSKVINDLKAPYK